MAKVTISEVGAGHFSTVFGIKHLTESSPNDFVIKVGGAGGRISEDNWWEFAKWVMEKTSRKNCPGRIHLPDIRYADRGTGIAVMKKLKNTLSGAVGRDRNAIIRKYFPNSRVDGVNIDTLDRMIYAIGKYLSDWHIKKLVMPKRFGTPSKDWKKFVFFLKWFRKNFPHRCNDLHGGNIMFDEQYNLVITDPASWA